jgi:hypothetical protein
MALRLRLAGLRVRLGIIGDSETRVTHRGTGSGRPPVSVFAGCHLNWAIIGCRLLRVH